MVRKVLSEPKRGAVTREEYLGDFQLHSRGSDGADTIEVLAKGCMTRGYQCMCVTDHSYGLPIAGGMRMDEMRAQHAEINKLNKKLGGEFRVFKGVEANILQDGLLDMHPSELSEFDLVVASPHSSLRKTIDQTERMLKAVSTPGVHILGPRADACSIHVRESSPTGRRCSNARQKPEWPSSSTATSRDRIWTTESLWRPKKLDVSSHSTATRMLPINPHHQLLACRRHIELGEKLFAGWRRLRLRHDNPRGQSASY